jgi:hypothetical protein
MTGGHELPVAGDRWLAEYSEHKQRSAQIEPDLGAASF